MLFDFFDEIVNGSAVRRVCFWIIFLAGLAFAVSELGEHVQFYGEDTYSRILRFAIWFLIGGVFYNYYLAIKRKKQKEK